MQAAHFDELLAAVNCVRAANGSAALTWSNLFSAGTEPAVGHAILAAHITTLRARMDEALTALGLPTTAYATDPTINNTVLIKRAHITELRDRTQ